jgi:methionyl-tRNA formyltransferase
MVTLLLKINKFNIGLIPNCYFLLLVKFTPITMNINCELISEGEVIFSKSEKLSQNAKLQDLLEKLQKIGEESVEAVHTEISKKNLNQETQGNKNETIKEK